MNGVLWRRLCSGLLAFIFLGGPAFGQADIRESVAGFAPDFFASSHPPSAFEMVRLLPGFRLQEGDSNVRGYSGAVGNVLIDGRPPASKEDKLEDILKRISAASVDHVELIRTGAEGVDMQGFPMLANVVRKTTSALRGQVEVEMMNIPIYNMGQSRLTGQVTLGTTEVLDVTASASRTIFDQMGGNGSRDRLRQDGTVLRLATSDQPRYEDDWLLSATWRQPLLGGNLRLNGLVKQIRNFSLGLETIYFPTPVVVTPSGERDMLDTNEFGLQYQHGLWSDAETEWIVIRRGKSERDVQTVTNPTSVDTTIKAAYSSESILRGALRQRSGDFLFEAGAESAINTLNNDFDYLVGGVPIVLPGSNVHISEWRTEYFGTATWQVEPSLTVEAGLRYENSFLKQQGDSPIKKDLAYLKPHALARWKPFANDELRLLFERRAGQLDFNNFVPVIMLSSNQLQAGNKNVEPYTLWHAEAAWEHKLPGGSVVFTARREEITDVVDHVPVYAPSGAYDGNGNVGSGRRDEFQLDFLTTADSWGLDAWGIAGLTLQGTVLKRFSQVTDPITGRRRHISNDTPVEGKISLTQDLPQYRARWGLTYNANVDRWTYKINEIKHDKWAEGLDAFVEYKPTQEWLVRLSARNILDRPVLHNREIYTGLREFSPYNFTENRIALIGVRYGITIQRTFGN